MVRLIVSRIDSCMVGLLGLFRNHARLLNQQTAQSMTVFQQIIGCQVASDSQGQA